MKTNLDFTHPELVEKKKLILIEKYMVKGFEVLTFDNQRRKGLGHLGQQSPHFFVKQVITNMIMN
jgi:hypothetical protein